MYTHSVLSTVGVVGIIIRIQLTKIVVIINNENKGCTRMYIATLLMGLNGSSIHKALVAENLKISLPLLMTTKVCNKSTRELIRSLPYQWWLSEQVRTCLCIQNKQLFQHTSLGTTVHDINEKKRLYLNGLKQQCKRKTIHHVFFYDFPLKKWTKLFISMQLHIHTVSTNVVFIS